MEEIEIRECVAIDELDNCVRLQRDVFRLPDLEISPRRHLIVSRQAGGWTLGAFAGERLVGFVHTLAGVRHGNEIFAYSHMMAVAPDFQNQGVGAKLKWRQRERALKEGRSFIKWTWDPMQARNAYFNLNRLGVRVSEYAANFYGTDYPASPAPTDGIDSDRVFASWELGAAEVMALANGGVPARQAKPAATISIPVNWNKLSSDNPALGKQEQLRVRDQFQTSFAKGLIAAGFERSNEEPRYLLYDPEHLRDR
jgi:predicted GNAT superfamily acetyltransferase